MFTNLAIVWGAHIVKGHYWTLKLNLKLPKQGIDLIFCLWFFARLTASVQFGVQYPIYINIYTYILYTHMILYIYTYDYIYIWLYIWLYIYMIIYMIICIHIIYIYIFHIIYSCKTHTPSKSSSQTPGRVSTCRYVRFPAQNLWIPPKSKSNLHSTFTNIWYMYM